MAQKRTRALSISPAVREKVWARDEECCVWCGNSNASANAHFIARSQAGLGIEQNILTLCANCHRRFDQSADRQWMKEHLREYLSSKYPGWDEQKLYYTNRSE